MSLKDIIVIGSSAGGIEALKRLCAGLPEGFPASIFIAQHIAPTRSSTLPRILSRAGPLRATTPEDGEEIERGRIYIAAPDQHMLLRKGKILMRRGPLENRTRPSANVLFRSAALAYGSRTIGLVLTGLLDDGTDGLIAIKAAGGTSVVQDPDDAEWPSMPSNALERDHVDYSLALDELPPLLLRLCQEAAGPSVSLPDEFATEDCIAAQDIAITMPDSRLETPGAPSVFSCPDCGGVLSQMETDGQERFRCQIGHAFTTLGLAEAHNDSIERALSVAARTHKERVRLFAQMERRAQTRGLTHAQRRWSVASGESEAMITVLEQAIAQLRRARAGD